LNIPRIKLKIPFEVIDKFDKIYDLYTGDYLSKEYKSYLNENNQWEKPYY